MAPPPKLTNVVHESHNLPSQLIPVSLRGVIWLSIVTIGVVLNRTDARHLVFLRLGGLRCEDVPY